MSATNPSTPANENVKSSASIDDASASASTWENIPSKTPSVSEAEAEIDGVETATAKVSLSDAFECTTVDIIENRDSDFILHTDVGERVVHYMVSADVLRITSPVLRKLIERNSDQYPASPDDRDKVCGVCGCRKIKGSLCLEDDDPDALRTVLQIVHCKHRQDLMKLEFPSVTMVAVVCEKYEWQNAILPWLLFWISKYSEKSLKSGYENWLRVAKAFKTEGSAELIEVLSDECGSLSKDPESGRTYVVRGTERVFTDLWPPESLGE
ncbi:hypothetical protein TWF281_003082 [Arthrobotrys megalospora]